MRLHEVAHEIDYLIGMSLDVPPEHVALLLTYVTAGYQVDGKRMLRATELEVAIRCADCPDKKERCSDTCPVYRAMSE